MVPELIDLAAWRRHLADFAAPRMRERFTVLYVGRFYRRKRVGLLLEAAAELRAAIPNLEIRIVGNGPCAAAWRAQAEQSEIGEHGHLAGRHFARRPGRRVQSRRRLLPAQRPGRLRHRAAGSDGGGQADRGGARGGDPRSRAARDPGGTG